MKESLFSDGGCIGPNPSPLGGTFAWCFVWGTREHECDSGIILPEQFGMKTISNNVAELVAAVSALEYVVKAWPGTLYTDSRITLLRLTTSNKFNGVPDNLRERCLHLRQGRKYNVVLLGGHPSISEIKNGRNKKGRLVSKWNVKCDERCQLLARRFIDERIE
jgi:ribonuclease HI